MRKEREEREYVRVAYTIHLLKEENLMLTTDQLEKALGSPKEEESKIAGYTAFGMEKSNRYQTIVEDLFVKKEYDKAQIMEILRPLAEGK